MILLRNILSIAACLLLLGLAACKPTPRAEANVSATALRGDPIDAVPQSAVLEEKSALPEEDSAPTGSPAPSPTVAAALDPVRPVEPVASAGGSPLAPSQAPAVAATPA